MRPILYIALFASLALGLPTEVEKKDEATTQTTAKTCGPGFSTTFSPFTRAQSFILPFFSLHSRAPNFAVL
ncbi:hypothetical protein ONS95_008730 [Cadophora gregata]|uniref:uncharacterized protein n=1 Tax=Cadophora gregata TaxID=51156 RepID=UPI0026DBE9E6|nr:uncharacterized protein ONS95_008730 [Cadophora gregata]KAK0123721.1 hypothetical protein ONS95_008730 [Cadophora gregata]KAK0130063.1 hypothetical protein ONS96_000600 [Cadophora gregata f. sp. sojae]